MAYRRGEAPASQCFGYRARKQAGAHRVDRLGPKAQLRNARPSIGSVRAFERSIALNGLPRSASRIEEMDKRSRRRIRDLENLLAS